MFGASFELASAMEFGLYRSLGDGQDIWPVKNRVTYPKRSLPQQTEEEKPRGENR